MHELCSAVDMLTQYEWCDHIAYQYAAITGVVTPHMIETPVLVLASITNSHCRLSSAIERLNELGLNG